MMGDIRWNGRFRLSNREQFDPKFRKICLSTNGPLNGETRYRDSCSQGLSLYTVPVLGLRHLKAPVIKLALAEISVTRRRTGKYELRPAVKKLYQLRPKVTSSSVSVASRG
jgi:hypothetical protein